MAFTKWPNPKDPQSNKEYYVKWDKHIGYGITIVSSVWDLPLGLVKTAEGINGQTTMIKLAGGDSGKSYECDNTILTSNDETINRTIVLKVKNR